MSNTILLVEDNPDDVMLTLRAFKKNRIGNPIDVVRDGEEAIAYLRRTGPFQTHAVRKLPCLMLLDIKLPKISGLEVLETIRADERYARIPIVMLTSSDQESDIDRGYRLGANSYLRKPVSFTDFMKVVQQLSDYWLTLNLSQSSSFASETAPDIAKESV